jgi:glucose-6-phosphate isomerase
MKYVQGLEIQAELCRKEIQGRLKEMHENDFSRRFWNKDKTLWNDPEHPVDLSEFLMGWLNVVDQMIPAIPEIETFAEKIMQEDYKHAVLLGMGGSSLAPLILSEAFTGSPGLKLHVLDSTDAETIRDTETKIGSEKTLFIVSSKSGSTVEVKSLYAYFFEKVRKRNNPGDDFIAITDGNTPLHKLATQERFKKVFVNFNDIGGRYSALSYFGMVPAALAGVDIRSVLNRARVMTEACSTHVPVAENPGIVLGVALAELARYGCNKLSYFMPPSMQTFGLWIEQLVAESTGKNGKGILPMRGDTNCVTSDQVLFFLNFASKEKLAVDRAINFLPDSAPCIRIEIKDKLDLGKEFFRWEVATATAGALLKINPFDQPNVQESKTRMNQILQGISDKASLPAPSCTDQGLRIYGKEHYSDIKEALQKTVTNREPGIFVVLQAYLPMTEEVREKLEAIRAILINKTRRPVSIDFGPRYLHSTGQLYKGGPGNGIYLQFVSASDQDLPIPNQPYTFDLLKKTQALGDMQALVEQNRNVLLTDLGSNVKEQLELFRQILASTDLIPWQKDDDTSPGVQEPQVRKNKTRKI